jgi:hypothetical protein
LGPDDPARTRKRVPGRVHSFLASGVTWAPNRRHAMSETVRSSSSPLPASVWILSLVGGALLVFLGGRILARRWIAQVSQAAPAAASDLWTQLAPDAVLPPTAESDAHLRGLLGVLAPGRLFHGFLRNGDLLQRWVVATVAVAEDRVPQRDLPFLAPGRPLSAARQAGRSVLAERSTARFDALARIVGAIDAHRFAQAYAVAHPWLESAYHQLGYPGRDFDQATVEALQRLSDAKVADGPVALESAPSGLWIFTDERLEKLGPVEKQLLRMGPANTRIVQGKARELASALRLPLRSPPQASRE